MASVILSASPSLVTSLSCAVRPGTSANRLSSVCSIVRTGVLSRKPFSCDSSQFHLQGNGLKLAKVQIAKLAKGVSPFALRYSKTAISCSMAGPETLKDVQGIIAKQLSSEESTVAPNTKFVDLGADSLDFVEIMMALEKFSVSIGEGGAENISTVQEVADLIEKVKAAA